MSISKLRSSEYADKVLSSGYLRSDKTPKTDPCGTPEISSKKVLHALLIRTDCFLFLTDQ